MSVEKPKPLALLIPGLDGTGKLYFRQTAALSARYRVRCCSYPRGGSFGFPDLVAELDRASAGEEPGSVLAVGESFGGTVAMEYALQHAERIRTLVLVNTFCYYGHPVWIRLACMLAPFLRARGCSQLKHSVVDRMLAREGIVEADRLRYHEIVKSVDPAGYRRRLQLIRTLDLRPRLKDLAAPAVLFASGRDKLVPSIEQARLMGSLIPDARVYEIPNAGHALLLTPGFSLADFV
jgi:pimeloyl-ACP methyl ester carboxylesterase